MRKMQKILYNDKCISVETRYNNSTRIQAALH